MINYKNKNINNQYDKEQSAIIFETLTYSVSTVTGVYLFFIVLHFCF